jgi:YVTN family beta-propeller protein
VSLGLGVTPAPGAKLLGTVDVAAVDGIAEFTDLAIDSAGAGYTLVATAAALGAESGPFDVGGVIAAITFDRWQPVAAAVNPVTGLAYIPGLNNGVGVLDPGKGQVTMVPGFETPFGVAVNTVTNRIYVTTLQGVVVMDGRDNAPIATIPVGPDPKGIAVDEGTDRVFVAVAGDPAKGEPPALALVDGKDNRVLATIPFPEGALAGVGVAFNPNDRLVYVAIPNVGVGVFDPEGVKFVGAISIVGDKGAAGTYGVALDVRTNLLYATNREENTASVIELSTLKEVQRLRVGSRPEGIGIDAERGAVYVGNSGDNTVSFIDAGKLTVSATLMVGPNPKAAAVNPGTGQVYVPTVGDDQVRVVQP